MNNVDNRARIDFDLAFDEVRNLSNSKLRLLAEFYNSKRYRGISMSSEQYANYLHVLGEYNKRFNGVS